MKVLFVVGYCLKTNSSANLCHASYINGFLQLGHSVDLLTASSKNQPVDKSIDLPNVDNVFEYDVSQYYQLSEKKRLRRMNANQSNATNSSSKIETVETNKVSIKSKMIAKVKECIRKSYGPYLADIVWYHNAKSFRSDTQYDLVVSLVHPPISAKLANYLIKSGHITTKKAIQIWEDPWSTDVDSIWVTKQSAPAEEKLFEYSDKTIYVSPLTLNNQQKAFPNYKEKMCWHPLPAYYPVESKEYDFNHLKFGYFGDYDSSIRNLMPFINCAMNNGYFVNICGNTDLSVKSTDNISIYPRMPLSQLKAFEDETNVIVFLCNSKGGQIPGKLYQYSASNKAILFILDGTDEEINILKEYFEKFDRYVFCENNEDSIKAAVERIPQIIADPKYTTPLNIFDTKNIIRDILQEVGM